MPAWVVVLIVIVGAALLYAFMTGTFSSILAGRKRANQGEAESRATWRRGDQGGSPR